MKKFVWEIRLIGYSEFPKYFIARNHDQAMRLLLDWFDDNKIDVTQISITNLGELTN